MKSLYYLHLNKSAGRFFYNYVICDMKRAVEKAGLEYLLPPTKIKNWTHHGWNSLITDDTYIVCSLRDPVEAIVSYRLHHSNIIDKEDFFNRIHEATNIQSRSFVEWDDNMVDPFVPVDFNNENIINRLKRVNLVLDSKSINLSNVDSIKRKIAEDLGIKDVLYSLREDTDEFRTPGVKEFCDSLTKEEIDIIKEVNYMDVELYEAAKSLFYPI